MPVRFKIDANITFFSFMMQMFNSCWHAAHIYFLNNNNKIENIIITLFRYNYLKILCLFFKEKQRAKKIHMKENQATK